MPRAFAAARKELNLHDGIDFTGVIDGADPFSVRHELHEEIELSSHRANIGNPRHVAAGMLIACNDLWLRCSSSLQPPQWEWSW